MQGAHTMCCEGAANTPEQDGGLAQGMGHTRTLSPPNTAPPNAYRAGSWHSRLSRGQATFLVSPFAMPASPKAASTAIRQTTIFISYCKRIAALLAPGLINHADGADCLLEVLGGTSCLKSFPACAQDLKIKNAGGRSSRAVPLKAGRRLFQGSRLWRQMSIGASPALHEAMCALKMGRPRTMSIKRMLFQ